MPFCSSPVQLWPILFRVIPPTVDVVFAIGLYYGPGKPADVHHYMAALLQELTTLCEKKLTFPCNSSNAVSLASVICDAPARAHVKRTKGHSRYRSCRKCCQPGEYVNNRVTLPLTTSRARTNWSFGREDAKLFHHLSVCQLTWLKRSPQTICMRSVWV